METARRTRISLFLGISLPSLHDYNVKGPNFTFCGGREQDNDFLFLFLDFGTVFSIRRRGCCLLLKPRVKGWYPMSRNFNVRTCVKVTFANKIEAMHERSLVSVKVEHRSTFKLSTFYVIKIFTCVNVRSKFASVEINLNGRNMVDEQLPTLLDVTCCVRKTCCVRLHVKLVNISQIAFRCVKSRDFSCFAEMRTLWALNWLPNLSLHSCLDCGVSSPRSDQDLWRYAIKVKSSNN